MTRFVIDLDIVLQIAGGTLTPDPAHELLSPTRLRSDVLEALYGRVRRGEMAEEEGQVLNARFAKVKLRYLGDAVLRRRAWALAAAAGLETTAQAEYLALTQLQADALVAGGAALARLAEGVVPLAPPEALTA